MRIRPMRTGDVTAAEHLTARAFSWTGNGDWSPRPPAALPPDVDASVRYLTSDQEWAIDVGAAAGLSVHQDGYLALRQMHPPAPYVPSVSFG